MTDWTNRHVRHNKQVNATAKPLRDLVPFALCAPAARYLSR